MRRWLATVALLWVSFLVPACGEQALEPREAADPALEAPPRELAFTVSEPVALGSGAPAAGVAIEDSAAFVSLPPGSLTGVITVRIENLRTGFEQTYLLADGGLDPVAVPAAVGDTIRLEAREPDGTLVAGLRVVSPESRARIVRTRPAAKKRDVPLNAIIEVVFSEPMRDGTLGDSAVQLLLGAEPVPVTARFQNASRTIVEIVPLQRLRGLTEYRLVVTRSARDLSGDAVEDGIDITFTTAEEPVPLLLRSVSAGAGHTCGITPDGSTVCWGVNISAASPQRMDVPAFDGIAAGGTAVCGYAQSVLCLTGHEWLMGKPTDGIGGTGIFQEDFSTMSTGGDRACGLLEQGGIRCWGRYQVTSVHQIFLGGPNPIAADSVLVALSSGAEHDCGITASGRAYCWGFDNAGQLGAEGQRFSTAPDSIAIFALAVDTDLRFAAIGAGGDTSCGITHGGELHCWGNDISPVPGFELRPVRIDAPPGLAAVTVGYEHACVLDGAGTAWCWGSGDDGQGGVVAIGDRPGAPVPGLTFRSLSAGSHHTCGIATDDTVWCWGLNESGQLGDGTTVARTAPVQVTWSP